MHGLGNAEDPNGVVDQTLLVGGYASVHHGHAVEDVDHQVQDLRRIPEVLVELVGKVLERRVLAQGLVEDALGVLVAGSREVQVVDHELVDLAAGSVADLSVCGCQFGQHGEGSYEEDHLGAVVAGVEEIVAVGVAEAAAGALILGLVVALNVFALVDHMTENSSGYHAQRAAEEETDGTAYDFTEPGHYSLSMSIEHLPLGMGSVFFFFSSRISMVK